MEGGDALPYRITTTIFTPATPPRLRKVDADGTIKRQVPRTSTGAQTQATCTGSNQRHRPIRQLNSARKWEANGGEISTDEDASQTR